jgi:hypothetical protein
MAKKQMWKIVARLPRKYTVTLWHSTREQAQEMAQKLCVYGHHYVNPKNGVEEYTPPGQILSVKIYPPRDRSAAIVRREDAAQVQS